MRMYLVVRYDVSHRLATFDGDTAEIFFDERSFQAGLGFEDYFQYFGFAVGVGAEPYDFRARSTLREIVFFVAGNACYGKTFHIVQTFFTISVNDVVNGAGIIPFEHVQVKNVFPDEHFFTDFYDFVFAVFVEDDNIVDVGTVAYKFVPFQPGADKSFISVDV